MADSLFSSLVNMADPGVLRGIGSTLGESDQSVTRGVRSSIAAVMGALSSRAGDSNGLRGMLDLVPGNTPDLGFAQIFNNATNQQSSAIATGKRVLSGLFGSSESNVMNAIGRGSGLRSNTVSTLMASIAPFVLGFIGRKVRDGGTGMNGLAGLLQRDATAIRGALPDELGDVFWHRAAGTTAVTADPVVAQTVQHETVQTAIVQTETKKSRNWALPLVLGALA